MPTLYSFVLLLSPVIVTEAVDSFGIVKPQSVTTKTFLSISNNRFVLKQPLFVLCSYEALLYNDFSERTVAVLYNVQACCWFCYVLTIDGVTRDFLNIRS